MSKLRNLQISIAVLVLATAACLCGDTSSPPQVIGEATPINTTAPSFQSYQAGEIIQFGSTTITLNSASIQGGKLTANFTVENKGSEEMTVSSLLLFSAKSEDGTLLEQEIFECESGALDGTILPGDKLRGNICWTGVTTSTAKIYYEGGLFSSGDTVVWEVFE